MSCGRYAVNSFRRFDPRLGTLRRSMSTAVRLLMGPPTKTSRLNKLRAHASSLSARGLETRTDASARVQSEDSLLRRTTARGLRMLAACRDTSRKQSEQKVNTALIGWSCRPWAAEELNFGGALSH